MGRLSARGLVVIAIITIIGCRVPAAIEPPQVSSAEAARDPIAEHDEDEHEYQAPAELPPSPNPAPPEQPDSSIGFGSSTHELPARVSVRTLSVEPDEFRSSLGPHSKSGDALLACVRNSQVDATTSKGSMIVDYTIGSSARVTAVTIRSCDFGSQTICDCMSDVVAKWSFRPNVQLVSVSVQIDAYPRRRH